MKVLLLMLVLAVPASADVITGEFLAQSVVSQGCSGCGFLPAGTIEQSVSGVRYVNMGGLVGTVLIPFEYQWVTYGRPWLWDGLNLVNLGQALDWAWVSAGSRSFSDTLLPLISVQESGGGVTVLFSGFLIGQSSGTAAALSSSAIPEPMSWVLMLSGLVVLALIRAWLSPLSAS